MTTESGTHGDLVRQPYVKDGEVLWKNEGGIDVIHILKDKTGLTVTFQGSFLILLKECRGLMLKSEGSITKELMTDQKISLLI